MAESIGSLVRSLDPERFSEKSDEELEASVKKRYPDKSDDQIRAALSRKLGATQDVGAAVQGAESLQAAPWHTQRGTELEGARQGALSGAAIAGGMTPYLAPVTVPAGAVAGAALGSIGRMPSVREFTASLPSAAGAIGGALAGEAPLLGTATAGVGGAVGEASRQVVDSALTGQNQLSREAIADAAAREAMLEGGGRVLGGAAGRVLAPGARSVSGPTSEAMQRLEQRAADEGLGWTNPPAAALSRSPVVALAEGIASKTPGGGRIAQRYESSARAITAVADHAVKRSGKLASASERGRVISGGFDASRKVFQQETSKLYKQVDLRGIPFQGDDVVRVLDDLIESKQASKNIADITDAKMFRQMRDSLSKTGESAPSAFEARAFKQELSKKIKGITKNQAGATGDKGELTRLSAALNRDLMASIGRENPEVAAKLIAANEAWATGKRKLETVAGHEFKKLADAGAYDKLSKAVVNPNTSLDLLPGVFDVVGPEGTEAIRVSTIADLLEKAKTGKGSEGIQTLTPKSLDNAMKGYGYDRLQAVLTPDQYQRLSDAAQGMAALEKGTKVISGSQTAFSQNLLNMGAKAGTLATAGVAGGSVAGAPGMLAFLVGMPAYARFASSEAGQRWLTSGYGSVSGASRLGGTASHGVSWQQEQERIRREGLYEGQRR